LFLHGVLRGIYNSAIEFLFLNVLLLKHLLRTCSKLNSTFSHVIALVKSHKRNVSFSDSSRGAHHILVCTVLYFMDMQKVL
jgi:hypothetical protein